MATALPRWWSKDTIAVVTGSNKGIGYGIVKGLARNGVTTVLTARDPGRGQKAVDSLKAEGLDSVLFHPLDVSNAESIENLAGWLKKEFGGVDILINNAGVAEFEVNYEGVAEFKVNYEAAKYTLDVNYYGVKNVTKALFPLLRTGARIVNVSSTLGQLSYLRSASLKEKLGDLDNLTEEFVDFYANKYLEDVKAGRWKAEGWSLQYPQYTDSKLLLNAYTRAFAKTLVSRPESQGILVNVLCPGYIGTDLNNNSGPGTIEEGADTPVWLSLLPLENYPNGQFFKNRAPLAF